MYELGTATHGVERKAARVAEHIQHALALGEFLEQGTILTLVNEEACLLATKPINIEAQAVFNGDIIVAAAQQEAILRLHKG